VTEESNKNLKLRVGVELFLSFFLLQVQLDRTSAQQNNNFIPFVLFLFFYVMQCKESLTIPT
jgi:hypothetical protein